MRCGGIYAGWRTNENRVWIVLIAAYLVLTSISLFYLLYLWASTGASPLHTARLLWLNFHLAFGQIAATQSPIPTARRQWRI